MTDPRYPIGKYEPAQTISIDIIDNWISDIGIFPVKLKALVTPMTNEQLDTPYREGGWTVRQVVHHLADSHLNGYCRFKWALTEKKPTIKTYDQDEWSKLDDYNMPVDISLDILLNIHKRWKYILESLSFEDFQKEFIHPETGTQNIAWLVGLYAWHGKHHTGHIGLVIERQTRKNRKQ